MHLYGLRTPYKENGLKARVRYPLYIVIYCKRVHYTADSLVWGLLRLAPNSYTMAAGVYVSEIPSSHGITDTCHFWRTHLISTVKNGNSVTILWLTCFDD